MSEDEIEVVVCDILIHDGPDGHVDGYDIITDFILALLENRGHEWKTKYLERKTRRAAEALT